MRRIAAQELDKNFPQVAVIVPIKGIDEHTPENLRALLDQDYPNYHLIFAVESSDDPVCELLHSLSLTQAPERVKLVVSGHTQKRGQKVHNQLAAIDTTTEKDEILAFMDADAHPNPRWLHALVLPLTYHPWYIGATTGYRFYVPANNHPANGILCAINAKIAGLIGPYRWTAAWGGSMAMRRNDFFSYGVFRAWQGALSDDFAVTYCVKKIARSRIHFVPLCMVASAGTFNWRTLQEFAVRQYRITRVCALSLWFSAFIGALLFCLTLLSAPIAAIIAAAFSQRLWWTGLAVFGAVYLLAIWRGILLLRNARKLLPDHWPEIRQARPWFIMGSPLVQGFNLFYLVCSCFGNTITWRGIRYKMKSRTQTEVLG